MEKKIEKLEARIELILTNHLPHLSDAVTKIGVNVDWLQRFFWIVATASIGSLLTAILSLLLKK